MEEWENFEKKESLQIKWINIQSEDSLCYFSPQRHRLFHLRLFNEMNILSSIWWQKKVLFLLLIYFCWLTGCGRWKRFNKFIFCKTVPKKDDTKRLHKLARWKISMHHSEYMLIWNKQRTRGFGIYTPEHSWYSGSCLTLVTWRLSGSRQLHKAAAILTKKAELRIMLIVFLWQLRLHISHE